jgi:hypothetical protein
MVAMEMPRVEIVKVEPGFRLWLRFSDSLEGVVDLSGELSGPVFGQLREPAFFALVEVDHDLGTVVWPNGADFAPEELYERVLKHHSYA